MEKKIPRVTYCIIPFILYISEMTKFYKWRTDQWLQGFKDGREADVIIKGQHQRSLYSRNCPVQYLFCIGIHKSTHAHTQVRTNKTGAI